MFYSKLLAEKADHLHARISINLEHIGYLMQKIETQLFFKKDARSKNYKEYIKMLNNYNNFMVRWNERLQAIDKRDEYLIEKLSIDNKSFVHMNSMITKIETLAKKVGIKIKY